MAKTNKNELTFADHLREFKHRIVFTTGVFIICFILCYIHCDTLLTYLVKIGEDVGFNFVYISPQEILVQQLRLAGVFALLITIPVAVYNIAAFLAPVFTDDKHAILKMTIYCISALAMFAIGVIFAYKVLLPFIYRFLYDIGCNSDIEAQISTEKYLDLLITVTLCLGVIFEMPLLCILLTLMGIINSSAMIKARPIVLVGSFIVGAVITPPDVLSQVMVALPMVVLYQISIILCKVIGKEKNHDGDNVT